jgi:hypothetical protein
MLSGREYQLVSNIKIYKDLCRPRGNELTSMFGCSHAREFGRMSALLQQARDIEVSGKEDRRRWSRIPVAIPVFLRGKDQDGKEFREFTTAFNIGGGGVLLATRRFVPRSSKVFLEIPAGPLSSQPMPQKYYRDLVGRAVTVTHTEQCYLCGVKFTRPLIQPMPMKSAPKKK